jgi:hypothetical protein
MKRSQATLDEFAFLFGLQEKQQFPIAAFNALIAMEAAEFQMVVLKDVYLQSFTDQRYREPDCIGSCPFNEEVKTSTVEQTHGGEES